MLKRIMSVFCLLTFLVSLAPLNVLASTGPAYGETSAKVLTDEEMKGISGGNGWCISTLGACNKQPGPPPPATGSLGGTCYTDHWAIQAAPEMGGGLSSGVQRKTPRRGVPPPRIELPAKATWIVSPGTVEGAYVTLSGPTSGTPRDADSLGGYSWAQLNPGYYSVSANKTNTVTLTTYNPDKTPITQTKTYALSGSGGGEVVANKGTTVDIKMALTIY